MLQVVIVGGGISGLAIAYRISQMAPAAEVTLLERGNRLGGTIWTERRDGFQVEIGPNGFLDTNPSTINICQELGLGTQLISASDAAARNRFLFLGGKLQPLPGGLGAFLRSDLLSWRGKLRLLTEPFRPRRRNTSDESIDAFARRRAGHEAADTFADALVTGIHAGDPALLAPRPRSPDSSVLRKRVVVSSGGLCATPASAGRKPKQADSPISGQAVCGHAALD